MVSINGFIGCRLGSTRVKFKNLSLLDEKPLFTYLTDSALKSSNINKLFLNTDSKYIVDIAKKIYKNQLNYYIRPGNLGSSKAKLDDFVYDFMINFPSEITIFFNPCCLFLKSETIDRAINYFIKNNLDSSSRKSFILGDESKIFMSFSFFESRILKVFESIFFLLSSERREKFDLRNFFNSFTYLFLLSKLPNELICKNSSFLIPIEVKNFSAKIITLISSIKLLPPNTSTPT